MQSNEREREQNTHQETCNMFEEHTQKTTSIFYRLSYVFSYVFIYISLFIIILLIYVSDVLNFWFRVYGSFIIYLDYHCFVYVIYVLFIVLIYQGQNPPWDYLFSYRSLSHFLFLTHRFNVGPDPYWKDSITGN